MPTGGVCTIMLCCPQEVEPEVLPGAPADGLGGVGAAVAGVVLGGEARVDGDGDADMEAGGVAEVAEAEEAEELDLQVSLGGRVARRG